MFRMVRMSFLDLKYFLELFKISKIISIDLILIEKKLIFGIS